MSTKALTTVSRQPAVVDSTARVVSVKHDAPVKPSERPQERSVARVKETPAEEPKRATEPPRVAKVVYPRPRPRPPGSPFFKMATFAALGGLVVLHPEPFATAAQFGMGALHTLVRGQ